MASEPHGHSGHLPGYASGHPGGHRPDINDVAEHQRTFDAFVRFWVYVFGAAALILIFLGIFNT